MHSFRSFRRVALLGLATLTLTGSLTSCATVFGGRVAESQKRKPLPGEQRRQVRVGALVADILLFSLISIPVDFATGAIYKQPAATTTQSSPSTTTPVPAPKTK